MSKRLLALGIVPALLITGVAAHAYHVDEYRLEPCINGGVSASGGFASQTAEGLFAGRLAGG